MTAPFAAVIGWPAAHSLSPLMMATWLDAAGIAGRYGLFEIPPERFEAFLDAASGLGLTGVNVTLPHKEAALALADSVSDAARQVGAANRLVFSPDGRAAHNTDVDGIAAALAEDPGDGPAVLIGAGGAARAALHHLKGQDREVRIVNRTRSRADALIADMGVQAVTTSDPSSAMKGASLVINATSLGMTGKGDLAPDFSVSARDALAFDMVYTPVRTGFLRAAEAAGRRTVDGLTMLIGQARPSFAAFYGREPGSDLIVRPVLEQRLGGAP